MDKVKSEDVVSPERPYYSRALNALKEAHEVCFKHPDRGALGMTHGPFSGVNVALEIVAKLEHENQVLKKLLSNKSEQ